MSRFVREEKLFLAIGGVDDRLVAEAADPRKAPGRKATWRRWAAMAAALVLVAGAGVLRLLPFGGAGAGGAGISQSDAAPGAAVFMSYGGPALPLTILEGPEGLPATREVTWNFRDAVHTANSAITRVEITDETTLRNDGEQALTVTVACPVTATLRDEEELFPTLTVNGERLETGRIWGDAGTAAGGDYPTWDPRLDSWADCKALLEDGSYLEHARQEAPALDYTVTVWEFTDSTAPEVDTREMAPTLGVSFRINEEKTQVWSWGFNGYSGWEDGTKLYDYFVPRKDERDSGRRLLIFLGEVPEEYTVAGYENGACETPLEGVSARLTAFTTTLGEILDQLAEEQVEQYENPLTARLEDFQAAVRKLMARFLPGEPGYRDYFTMEDLLSHALVSTRVVWTAGEVTIPAGGEVTVTARYKKEPSFDFACASTRQRGLYGFDLGTALGSNLRFEEVIARLEDTAGLAVAGQNFGFDLPGGVDRVELDPGEEYYYMEVRVKEE